MILDKAEFDNFIFRFKNDIPSGSILSFTQSISKDIFEDLLESFLSRKDDYFYWSLPNENFSFLGYGKIISLKNNNSQNLNSLEDEIKSYLDNIITNRVSTVNAMHPLFMGGIKFPSSTHENIWKDFNSSEFFIPQILLLKENDHYLITLNFTNEQINEVNLWSGIDAFLLAVVKKDSAHFNIISSTESANLLKWTEQINTALKCINEGKHKKVVLARYKEIIFDKTPDVSSCIRKLETNYSNCYSFAFSSGNSVFFGATPEKLFKKENGILSTDALAGSIRRGIDEAEDVLLAQELLADPKNRAEHESVLDYIYEQLRPLSEKIIFDNEPKIKQLTNIQHLHTKIKAELKQNVSVIALLEKLFPTPAVCGNPKLAALATIDEIERFDRGLYAGAIGWFNNQNSEFAVSIRSAILKEEKLRAYAGCGIVEGSESNSEFDETELKLKPILSLFENETVS